MFVLCEIWGSYEGEDIEETAYSYSVFQFLGYH
jgi:hypothetical protein